VVLHQREIEAALTILAKRGVSSFKGGEKSNLILSAASADPPNATPAARLAASATPPDFRMLCSSRVGILSPFAKADLAGVFLTS
jgi:hypothetical protein